MRAMTRIATHGCPATPARTTPSAPASGSRRHLWWPQLPHEVCHTQSDRTTGEHVARVMFPAPDQGPVGCGRAGCQWNRQPGQLLSHTEDKGAVRRGVAGRERRGVRTDSALAGALRPAPVDEGLDNEVGDEGSDDVTHTLPRRAACRPLVPPLTASAVATLPQNGGCSTMRAAPASGVRNVATFRASSLGEDLWSGDTETAPAWGTAHTLPQCRTCHLREQLCRIPAEVLPTSRGGAKEPGPRPRCIRSGGRT
jgi:hypothetical protein